MNYIFDPLLLEGVNIKNSDVEAKIKQIKECDNSKLSIESLIKIIQHIDLTTLNAYDTKYTVQELCKKAIKPVNLELGSKLSASGFSFNYSTLHTAAVCVYPSRISDVVDYLKSSQNMGKINIASVAAGFPSGQYPLKTRLLEIECCVEYGANEIDIVIDRSLVMTEEWQKLFDEVKAMKDACKNGATLKTILAVGELRNYEEIFKASMISMMAGSDFIKTSTGKETVNATLEFGYIMCLAIKKFYDKTGVKIGLKPAGGIRTAQDALAWFHLIKSELGESWINPNLFRIGASGLLQDLQDNLYKLCLV